MACFKPIPAYRDGHGSVKFWPSNGHGEEFCVPCGTCVGCLLERSRQWAVRLVHENQLWDCSSFITLTYDDQHLPPGGALVLRDFQLFMKKLRKSLGKKISFFHCGEYGDDNLRPHYHAIVFGYSPVDQVLGGRRNGVDWYISPSLASLWGKGQCSVGRVTFESAAYVARYCLKKRKGGVYSDGAPRGPYWRVDPESGEMFEVPREYCTMSRRPAIADGWFARFSNDVYPSDEVIIGGRSQRPPRFYDRRLKKINCSLLEQLKTARVLRGLDFAADNSPERLRVKEAVVKSRSSSLLRNI